MVHNLTLMKTGRAAFYFLQANPFHFSSTLSLRQATGGQGALLYVLDESLYFSCQIKNGKVTARKPIVTHRVREWMIDFKKSW